jgi:FkbM family methyltransferase
VKNAIKGALQQALGYQRYLRFFAWFKVRTLRLDRREDDFFAFLALLPDAGTVLDIGANLGFLTAHLSSRVTRGRVIAFEPMPDNLHALAHVVETFNLNNVTIEPIAVGEHDGEVIMVLPVRGHARQQGLAHVVRGATGNAGDAGNGIRFTVPVRTLDSIAELFAKDVKVTGIKIDVENSEQFVLAGAERLLATHRPLIYLELGDDENRAACLEFFRRWGYVVAVNVNGTHVPYDALAHEDRINFLARPL